MAPGAWPGPPWCVIDCRAAAATLDRRSRHRPAVGVGGLALWRGHPARRCRASSVVHALGRRHSSLQVHLSSPLRLSISTYTEWEWWAAEPTLPRLAVPIKDVNERRMSLEIVYAAWHVRWCDVCMYAIRYVGLTAITRNLRPLILRQ